MFHVKPHVSLHNQYSKVACRKEFTSILKLTMRDKKIVKKTIHWKLLTMEFILLDCCISSGIVASIDFLVYQHAFLRAHWIEIRCATFGCVGEIQNLRKFSLWVHVCFSNSLIVKKECLCMNCLQ